MQSLGYRSIDKKLGIKKNSEGTLGCCSQENSYSLKGEIVFGTEGSNQLGQSGRPVKQGPAKERTFRKGPRPSERKACWLKVFFAERM